MPGRSHRQLCDPSSWRPPALETVGIADHGHRAEGHGQGRQERREQNAEERIEDAERHGEPERVVDEGAREILVHVAHRGAADLDVGDDTSQAAFDERDVGGGDGHVRTGADGKAHISLGQGRRVVDPVAHHRHTLASSWSFWMLKALSCGRTSARTRSMPTWRAIALPVRSLSPVIITTSSPMALSD